MKKVLKLLLSRIVFVFLAILLQVLFLLGIYLIPYYLFSQKFYWFSNALNLIVGVIAVIVAVFIINKEQPESFKLPWVVILLLVPIFGLFIFMLFGRKPLSKKQIRRYEKIRGKVRGEVAEDPEVVDAIRAISPDAYGQSRYIKTSSMMPLYGNTETKYHPSGESFYEELMIRVGMAEKYIFLEYFIVAEGKMLDGLLDLLYRKIDEGIAAYMIVDDFGSMGKISSIKLREIRNKGVHLVMFNPMIPVVSAIHNNRDHRKIMVVDGKYGMVGGVNIGDEYINLEHPYGHWKDTAVSIEGEGVRSLIAMFIENYNVSCRKGEELDVENFLSDWVKKSQGFVQPFCDGPEPLDHYRVGEDVYSNLICMAKKSIWITTPYLIVSYDFLQKLCIASEKGVDVRIITPYIADKKIVNILTKGNYEMLIRRGVKIYEYKPGFIHAKNFIVDGEYAVCGTINVDFRSFVHHYECGVWMYRTSAVDEMIADFERLIETDAIQIDEKDAKLNLFKKIVKEIINIFAPLF